MGRQQGRKGGGGKGAFRSGKEGKDTADKRQRDDEWHMDQRDQAQIKNEVFEAYYSRQTFFNNSVEAPADSSQPTPWDTCYAAFKVTLPMAVRINQNHPDREKIATLLINEFKHNGFRYDKEVDNAAAASSYASIEESGATLLRTLPFLNGLGLQTPLSRGDIKRGADHKRLKKILASFNEAGYITRQETVSMVPPLVLDVKPGMRVLDMCAAPGSKTSQLLEALVAGGYSSTTGTENNVFSDTYDVTKCRGVVVANDVNIARIDILTHQTGRAAHSHPHLIITNNDATTYPLFSQSEDKFDRVLCDVMCSGDGTLRKSIDLWSRWNPLQGADLHSSQLRTLLRGMSLVKAGGVVVYSTCSLNPIEDEAVIAEALLQAKGAFELIDPLEIDDSSATTTEFLNSAPAPSNSGRYATARRFVPGLRYSPGVTSWQLSTKEGKDFFPSFESANNYRRDVMKDKGFQFRSSMFPPVVDAPEYAEAFRAIAGGEEKPTSLDCLHLERCMRVLPHLQDTGGFFVAALRCKKDFSAVEVNLRRRQQQEEEAKKLAEEGFRKDLPYIPVAGSTIETTLVNNLELNPSVFPFDRILIRREAFFKATGAAAAAADDGYDSDGKAARGPRVSKLFLASAEAIHLMGRFPPSINIKQIGIKAFESYSRHSHDKFRVFAESYDTVCAYLAKQQVGASPSGPSFFARLTSEADLKWLIDFQEKSQGRTIVSTFLEHAEVCSVARGAYGQLDWSTKKVSSAAEWKQAMNKKSFAIMAPLFNDPTVIASADESQRSLQASLASLSPVAVAGELDDAQMYITIKILPHHLIMMRLSLYGAVVENQGSGCNNKNTDQPTNDKPRERDDDGEESDVDEASA